LAGLEGVLYANTLQGVSNTLEFLNFFDEATKATQIIRNPVSVAGDILVLDNCTTHHNAGGFALGLRLDTMGIDFGQSLKAGTWNIPENPGTSKIE